MTPIVTAPADVLSRPALTIDPTAPASLAVAGELMAVLQSTPHALAVAAPQIGESLRMIAYREDGEIKVMSNPRIVEVHGGKRADWEGCLSFPNQLFLVDRFRAVVVVGDDVVGDFVRVAAHKLTARMFQHEIDHLNGRLVDAIAKVSRRRK